MTTQSAEKLLEAFKSRIASATLNERECWIFNVGHASRDAEVAELKDAERRANEGWRLNVEAIKTELAEKDRLLKVALGAMEMTIDIRVSDDDVERALNNAIKAIKEAGK